MAFWTMKKVVTASGGTITLLNASGNVDNVNTQFGFTVEPSLVIVNGLSYYVGSGWSWNSGTLTATLDNPVGSGGTIIGIE